jgi:SERTA motif
VVLRLKQSSHKVTLNIDEKAICVESISGIKLCERIAESLKAHITSVNMTLPETVEHHYSEDEEAALSDDDIFGPARTILRRTKNKISMISNELRLREKRKRVLQLCLRKLERIKDSENNLRRSVVIHNTFSRLSNDIKRDKERGQNRNQQQQQQQHYK